MSLKTRKAFTLLELLIVIAIIGILSGIVLASLNSAREKARDTKRKAELKQVQLALESYFSTNGTYIVAGSGSGSQVGNNVLGCGCGWFNAYAVSVAQKLVDAGYFSTPIIDPSGVTTYNGTRSGYMIQASAVGYTLWANLENPSAVDTATMNSCRFSGYDGYHSTYLETARMNFCLSN